MSVQLEFNVRFNKITAGAEFPTWRLKLSLNHSDEFCEVLLVVFIESVYNTQPCREAEVGLQNTAQFTDAYTDAYICVCVCVCVCVYRQTDTHTHIGEEFFHALFEFAAR